MFDAFGFLPYHLAVEAARRLPLAQMTMEWNQQTMERRLGMGGERQQIPISEHRRPTANANTQLQLLHTQNSTAGHCIAKCVLCVCLIHVLVFVSPRKRRVVRRGVLPSRGRARRPPPCDLPL